MNETLITVMLITIGILIAMFTLAFVSVRIIKHKQNKEKFNSLPSGGSDGSEYSEMLAEKYRNQRIEKEL